MNSEAHNLLRMPVERHVYKYILYKYRPKSNTIPIRNKNDYHGIAQIITMMMMRRKKFRLTQKDRQTLNSYVLSKPTVIFEMNGDMLRYLSTYRLHSEDAYYFNRIVDLMFRSELMVRLETVVTYSEIEMLSAMRDFMAKCDITEDDINFNSLLRYVMRRKKVDTPLQEAINHKKCGKRHSACTIF